MLIRIPMKLRTLFWYTHEIAKLKPEYTESRTFQKKIREYLNGTAYAGLSIVDKRY